MPVSSPCQVNLIFWQRLSKGWKSQSCSGRGNHREGTKAHCSGFAMIPSVRSCLRSIWFCQVSTSRLWNWIEKRCRPSCRVSQPSLKQPRRIYVVLLLHLRPVELEQKSLVEGIQILLKELEDKSDLKVRSQSKMWRNCLRKLKNISSDFAGVD